MKVGILTYHRTNNYGAVLQAVATRKYLESIGHEVYYIDYWPQYHKDTYQVFNKKAFLKANFLKKLKILFKFPLNYLGKKKRIAAFNPFLEEHIIPYCRPYNAEDHYDAIIYGSDQIWRKQNGMNKEFNPVYFGENVLKADSHIAYAASMGKIHLSKEDEDFLEEHLQKFSVVGVREQNLFEILSTLNTQNLKLVIDPTLLLSCDEWDSLMPNSRIIKEKYVLLYQLGKSIDRKEAKKFADKRGLKLVVLASVFNWRYPNDIIATPNEFISLIKNAEYILTSSFHGLAFSINYSKEFYASYIENSNRALTLLNKTGIDYRLLPNRSKLPESCEPIDFHKVNILIEEYKKESKLVLKNSLERISTISLK